MRHVLRRAVGLDSHLVIDFLAGDLRPGDVFLIASDGVWEVLGPSTIDDTLAGGQSAESMARTLVEQSIENQQRYMGRNDATALVARVT